MEPKKICVLIRSSPYHSNEATEAMRMSVGLTLRDNEVYIVLLEGGLEALLQDQGGPFMRHLEAFVELGQQLIVEKEALLASGQGPLRQLYTSIWSREDIYSFMARCDTVIIV